MKDYDFRRIDLAQMIDAQFTKQFGKLYPDNPIYHKFAMFKKDIISEIEIGVLRWEAQMRRDIEEDIMAQVKKRKARRVYMDGTPKTDVIGQEM